MMVFEINVWVEVILIFKFFFNVNVKMYMY